VLDLEASQPGCGVRTIKNGLATVYVTLATVLAVIPLFFAQLRTFDSEEVELAHKLEPHLLAFVEEIA
jgi:hypothetical protein